MSEQFGTLAATTLSAGVNNAVTTLPVTSGAAPFPQSAQFRIVVDSEIMIVTGGAGTTSWTVTRGAESTTAAAHSSGAAVTHVLTAGALGGVSDPAAGTPGLRTLGTGSTQAAAGNDSRLSDARTPTAHASTHGSGQSDAITIAESQVTNLTSDLAAKMASTQTLNGIATANATTADVAMNSHKITGLANGSASSDAAAFGQIPTAGSVGAFPKIVRRTANSTAVNSGTTGTTLTNDDTLLWTAVASEVDFVEAFLFFQAANATMDTKFTFTGPSGASAQWGQLSGMGVNFGGSALRPPLRRRSRRSRSAASSSQRRSLG